MTRGGRRRPLVSRIVSTIAVVLVVSVAVMVFAAHRIEFELNRDRAIAQFTAITEIIGNRSAAAVLFRDKEAAERNLAAARFHPDLRVLCLYTLEGRLLATFDSGDDREACREAAEMPLETVQVLAGSDSSYQFVKAVRAKGDVPVGHLLVNATLASVNDASRRFAYALWGLFLVSVVVIFVLVRLIVRRAFKPLSSLRDTVSSIGRDPDLLRRATRASNDEVGDLVDAFNRMLDRLAEKDEAVRRSERAAREVQTMRALSQLSGGIAHDFNNILTIGMSSVELMELKTGWNEESLPELKAMKTALSRGASLTKKLLGIARGEAKNVRIVDVNETIRALEDMFARAVVPLVSASVELEDDVGTILVDPGDLQDALLNLVINARDAMPGGGKVTVYSTRQHIEDGNALLDVLPKAGWYVRISVVDDGPGLSDEPVARVFEPFFSSKGGDHSGLGLAMVYGLADRSGGGVVLDTAPGEGATFNLYFPSVTGSAPSERREEGNDTTLVGTETVLLVDDEKSLLELGRGYLGSLGYRVLVAASSEEALGDAIQEQSIDAVVCDIVMPGAESGLEIVEKMRATRPEDSFVSFFVSGYFEGLTLPRLPDGSLPTVLRKPVTGQVIARELRRLLDAR